MTTGSYKLLLFSYTHYRVSDVCASMQKDLPKVVGKSNHLYLSNVFVDDLCTDECIHLLISNSLEHLVIFNSTISRSNWKRLTSAVAASSGLKELYIVNIGISIDSVMDLARALKQTKLKTLEKISITECEMEINITMLLLEAMSEIGVKKMFIGHGLSKDCNPLELKVVYKEDISYEGGRLLTLNVLR